MFMGCGNKVSRPGQPERHKRALSVLEAGPLPWLWAQPAILAFLVDLPLHPLPLSSRAFSPVCLSLCLFSSSYEDPKHIKLSAHTPAGGPHLTFILITSAKTVFPDEVTSMAPRAQARLSPAGGRGEGAHFSPGLTRMEMERWGRGPRSQAQGRRLGTADREDLPWRT